MDDMSPFFPGAFARRIRLFILDIRMAKPSQTGNTAHCSSDSYPFSLASDSHRGMETGRKRLSGVANCKALDSDGRRTVLFAINDRAVVTVMV